jgi:hypothetical protein
MYRPRSASRKLHLAAVLASVALAGPRSAADEIPSTWLAPVSGAWDDASKWSTSPLPPRNSPGVDYHATIDATGAAYTVTSTDFVSVGRLTLNSADALLVGSMTAREIDVLAGTWRVPSKSSIVNARVSTAGAGRIEFTQGTGANASSSSVLLSNVTLAADLVLDGIAATVGGTLTLDNATLRVGRSGSTGNITGLTIGQPATIAGTGTIELAGNNTNGATLSSVNRLTLGEGVTVRAVDGASTRVAAWIENHGTFLLDRPATTLMLGGNTVALQNFGTIRATAGTLKLDNIQNAGLIHVRNAAVNFANLTNNAGGSIVFDNAAASVGPPLGALVQVPSFSAAQLDQVTWTGNSTLAINARVDNAGRVFDASRYNVTSLAGELVGGTFTSPNPDVLTNPYTFTNVTLASDLNVRVALTASGNLTLDNATLRLGNATTGGTTFTQSGVGGGIRGQGRLVVASTTGARLFLGSAIDPGISIDVADGDLVIGEPTRRANLTNHGTITVSPRRTFTLYGGANFTNQGLIDLRDTATLAVDGPFPLSSLGTVNRAADTTIIWGPTLVDATAGATIDLNATPVGPVELGRASFSNVTLTAPGRNVDVFGNTSSQFGTNRASLNAVTLAADLDIRKAARFVVTKGLTLAGGSIHFHDGTDQFSFSELANGVGAAQALDGTGELVFDGPFGLPFGSTTPVPTAITTSGPLTIAPGVTVRTGDGSGRIVGQNQTLTNNGTISARGADHSITIDANLVNNGTVEAADGAIVGLVAPFTNTGTIRITDATLRLSGPSTRETFDALTGANATVEVTGAFDNTDRTLDVHDPARGITLALGASGSITGGAVTSADGTPLRVVGNATLFTTRVDAPIVVAPNVTLSINAAATPQGGVTLEDNARVAFGGTRSDAPVVHAGPGSWVTFSGLGSLANIELNGANLGIYSTQTTALVRTVSATNAAAWVAGTLNNAGDTLVTGADGLDWNLDGGKITGGRIEGATAASVLGADRGTLENVTVATSIANRATVYSFPPLTIAGTFAMEPNRGTPVSMTVDGQVNFASGSVSTLNGTLAGNGNAGVYSNARVTVQSVRDLFVGIDPGGTFALMPTAQGGKLSHPRAIALYRTGATTFLGTFDVADVPVIADFAPYTRLWIASAYAGGTWQGPSGLTSSYAATHPGTAIGFAYAMDLLGNHQDPAGTNLGETVGPTATYIRLTRAGDATLDGLVNFDDLLQLAKNYNASPTYSEWYRGDFNYDGHVNFDDLLILAKNYNGVMPDAPWSLASPAPTFPADLAAAFATAAVPEPSMLGLLTLLAPLALRRRRTR